MLPRAFISYSWDSEQHKAWVLALSTRLRNDGVETILDQWHLVPGDQVPEFMEKAVRENEYVLIICTPRYKERSDSRTGGVGYEGDIMTGEVFTTRNERKFIPILRLGTWRSAAPSWLTGKYYIDLHGEPYKEDQYQQLLTTVLGTRPQPPPVRQYLDLRVPCAHCGEKDSYKLRTSEWVVNRLIHCTKCGKSFYVHVVGQLGGFFTTIGKTHQDMEQASHTV